MIGRVPITERGRRLTGAATSPPIAGGNVYDKYGSTIRWSAGSCGGFCDELEALAIGTGAREVHEVGCGEGELLLRLARRGLRARGSDISEAVIDEARRRARGAGSTFVQGGADRGARSQPRTPPS